MPSGRASAPPSLRLGDLGGARVVRHDELGRAADKVQCADHALDPMDSLLARSGQGECVAGRAQGGDKDVSPRAVAQGRAGEIDKQFLARAVCLPHGTLEGLDPAPVVFAVLRVLVGARLGVVGLVLLPQQHQRHALAAELTVDLGKVGVDVIGIAAIGALAREQASLQLGLQSSSGSLRIY